jgi:hypothetical protein
MFHGIDFKASCDLRNLRDPQGCECSVACWNELIYKCSKVQRTHKLVPHHER